MACFVERNEMKYIICYYTPGDNMRNDLLISNVLRELDELILKFDTYYTLKNIKKNSPKDS